MARKENAALNGILLSEVDPRIIGIRIEEQAKADDASFESKGRLPGQKLAFKKRSSLTINIFFKIREISDLSERMQVIGKVNQWAVKGGELSVSYRGSQKLSVFLSQAASPGDIRNYAEEISLLFESDNWPYWSGLGSSYYLLTGTSGSTRIQIPGDAPTLVDISLYAIQNISHIRLTVDNKTIAISNADIPAAGYVQFKHDDQGVLHIKKGDVSLYPLLDMDSADCLLTEGGSASVSFETDGEAEIRISAIGRWH